MSNSEIALFGYHWQQSELEKVGNSSIYYLAMNMTSACNYRCPYCFVGLKNLKKGPGELDVKQKVSLIRQARTCGARVVVMPGKGEPMADKDFWGVLDEIRNQGMHLVVYTNAWYLSEDRIRALADYPISIYVKIDSLDESTYEEMVAKKGTFKKVRLNLDLLINYFHKTIKHNGKILSNLGINSVISVQSVDHIEAIHDWCEARQVFYTCRSPVKIGEAELTWDYLVEDQVFTLRKIGNKFAARKFTSATELDQCGIYRFGITVQNTGDVYVCPDAHEGFEPIGNIRDKPLAYLIARRNTLYPLNSDTGFCFVKSYKNPEEKRPELIASSVKMVS